ncbi:hypothetical protein A2841_02315 [Candidatus Kaiserbacteria bacterium RIFCSPHIGHO2_01_FULL_48_10]|uniref:ATP:glycerol 3-phosphotransferase n=1 Tax=Candidatus Kaiserbacteria bacterium RIFCSPHIGHO2_01_FULL_48_10 TaxID=1798476 RepID=A0A1F6C6M1_9BACT|nr:MAG: hypothetical protein A2841_02315 [Candidatus Kaiserbacteria bacterium RIFCSPHIGHO2_01_FULL_48_10]
MTSPDKAKKYSLVLDIGTSGIKAFVFDEHLNVVSRAHKALSRFSEHIDWTEQKPEDLLQISAELLKEAVAKSGIPEESFIGLGITNQRETTILWDRDSGKPVYPAIVWEDVRTKEYCQTLHKDFGILVREKTGLSIDPYFSAPKIRWILDNVKEARELLGLGRLVFGTVDSWILWNFLQGEKHLTDQTNASRTLLFNIKETKWDKELLDVFQIPKEILPEAHPSQSFFGNLKSDIVGFSLPVIAVCGDQQSSLFAAGTDVGTTKVTFGTGTFVSQVLGSDFLLSDKFFTMLIPSKDRPRYALEAKINSSGKKIENALGEPEKLQAVYKELAKQVNEYIQYLPHVPKEITIDGGGTRDGLAASILADITRLPIKSQTIFDGTALGVAMMVRENSLN